MTLQKKNRLKWFTLSTFIAVVLFGCGVSKEKSEQELNTPIELPNNLSDIPDSSFVPLVDMIGDARIIGVTEGTHGMNEPLDFRNSLIKYLVKENHIKVIAFESGLIESRQVNAYINGESLDLDSVLNNCITCTFGQFEQNRELLLWLREINESRTPENKVQFYGFDMSGCAPNPALENSSFALSEALKYFEEVDVEKFNDLGKKLIPFIDHLRLDDSPDDPKIQFFDLSEDKKIKLNELIDELIETLRENKEMYVNKSGGENYLWGMQSAICAKQNIQFLTNMLNPSQEYSVREKSMLENLQWILEIEKDEKILLFAHLAHLSKDIYVLNAEGKNVMPNNQFGEYINEHYGSEYTVIGNFYSYLDYYEGIDSVKINSFPEMMNKKYPYANFYLRLDKTDTIYNNPLIFGVPSGGGDVWMTPSKGVDIIFYTEKQHYFEKE